MTFRSRTLITGLVVLALSATAASATPMTYQERQAIASRGQGAPTPVVHVDTHPGARLASAHSQIHAYPGGRLALASTRTSGSSSAGTSWATIAAFIAAALAACLAIVAVGRRHTPATPS